jgi:putative acetyltransferase
VQQFKIGRATAADFDELTRLWEASVRATHDFLQEEDVRLYKSLVRAQYLAAVDLYCVRVNAAITGYIGISGTAIEMLFVHPSEHGKGVGKALAQFAIQELGCRRVDVNEQNAQALGFYRKIGFEVSGRSATDGMGKPYPLLHLHLA